MTNSIDSTDKKSELIKELATYGVTGKMSQSVETLENMLLEAQTAPSKDAKETTNNTVADVVQEPVKKAFVKESPGSIRKRALKLIRVNITCLNPAKKEMDGEIFSVTSKHTGTVKKFIPYDTNDKPYHIEQILLDALKERKYQEIRSKKDAQGNNIIDPESLKHKPEFSIEILPPLTAKELDELRQRQISSGSID